MSSIDNRVVEMQFDNSKFEKGIQTSIKSLDELKKGLDLKNSSKGLSELEKAGKRFSLENIGQSVESVASKFSTLGIIGVTALQNITNSAINAGKRMLESLTIAPIRQGLEEYELKMGSVQTIMASTGESLDTVNKYLEELNKYADKTIYSFSDMTSNIGKFTNAGVKLEDAVKAIQGISNEAAVSGANANEASRAMYNFAQALSAGYVKLIDWKSIENANMATVEFKQTLIDTAVELGTVVKVGDKYRSTTTDLNGKVSELFDSTSMFNDSLSSQWMTTDVLVKTLGMYADETTEIGKKAFAAAQDVKTFSQLMDTLKEAVGSGWAQTWELIFGDFEEAKGLWTGVSNVVGGFIDRMSDARNSMLREWKDLGGRNDLIESFKNAWEGIVSVITPIKDAFRDIFPPMTGKKLASMTAGLKELTSHLKVSDETAGKIKSTFKGLFSLLNGAISIVSIFAKGIVSLSKAIFPVGNGLLSLTAAIGDFISGTVTGTKETGFMTTALETLKTVISTVSEKLGEACGALAGWFGTLQNGQGILGGIKSVVGKIIDVIKSVIGGISGAIGGFSLDNLINIFSGGLIAAILVGVKKMVSIFTDFANKGPGLLDGIKNLLDGVGDSISAFTAKLKSNTLKSIAISIGILAAALFVLASIDSEKMGSALTALTGVTGDMVAAMALLSKMNTKGTSKAVKAMIGLSLGVLILSAALKNVAELSWNEIGKGLVGILGLSVILGGAIAGLQAAASKWKKGKVKGLISFAAAIWILSASLAKIAKLSWKEIGKGLSGIAGAAVIMGGAMTGLQAASSKWKGNIKGLTSFSLAIGVLSLSLAKIAKLSWKEIGKGLSGIAGAAVVMGGAIIALQAASSKWKGNIKGLISFSLAIGILSLSLMGIAKLDWQGVLKGLSGVAGLAVIMGGVLTGLSAAAKGFSAGNMLAASAAMLIMAAALAVLTPAFIALSMLSWEGIAKGLVAIAGAFTVMGVAGLVLSPLVPVILGLSAALALMGVGVLLAGAGLIALSAGLVALEGSIALLPSVLTGVAAGLVAFMTEILTALPSMLTALASSFAEAAPAIGEAFKVAVLSAIDVIVECTPRAAKAGLELIVELMNAISDHIGEITKLAAEIVTEFLNGIAENLPNVIDAAADLIANFLNGIAENLPQIIAAAVNLITSFIGGIASNLYQVIDSGFELAISFINGVADSLRNNTDDLIDAGKNLFDAIVDAGVQALGEGVSSIFDAGKDLIQGMIDGIKEMIGKVKDACKDVVKAVVDKLKSLLGIHSPSRVMRDEVGRYIVEGIAEGITEDMSAEEAAEKKAQNIVNAFKKELDRAGLQMTGEELSFDLWKATNGAQATENERLDRELEMQNNRIVKQNERVALAEGELTETLKYFAEDSDEAIEARNKLWQERIDLVEMENERDENYAEQQKAKYEREAEIAEAEYEKWLSSTDGIASSAEEKLNRQLAMLDRKADMLDMVAKNREGEWTRLAKKHGDDSEEAREAYKEYLDSCKEAQDAEKEVLAAIAQAHDDEVSAIEASTEAREARSEAWSAIYGATASQTEIDSRNIQSLADTVMSERDQLEEIKKKYVESKTNGATAEELKAFEKEYYEHLTSLTQAIDAYNTGAKQGEDAAREGDRLFNEYYQKYYKDFMEQFGGDQEKVKAAIESLVGNGYHWLQGFNSPVSEELQNEINSISPEEYYKGMETMVEGSAEVIGGGYDDFYQVGEYLGSGMCEGLKSTSDMLYEAAGDITAAAIEGAKDEGKINSPSKAFAEIGRFCVMGFADGLRKNSVYVAKEAAGMTGKAIDTVRSALEGLSSAVEDGLDTEPIIRPVIDLSNVGKGIGAINGAFAGRRTISIGDVSSRNVGATVEVMQNMPANVMRYDNSDVVKAVGELGGRLDRLGEAVSSMRIVMDTGALVGQTAPAMDKQLGRVAALKGRRL